MFFINTDIKGKDDLCDLCNQPFGDCDHIVYQVQSKKNYHPECNGYLNYLQEKEFWENNKSLENKEERDYYLKRAEKKYSVDIISYNKRITA
jgi:hypothetical protein